MKIAKQRLDVLVADRGLAESREKAQRLILAGQVLVAGHAATKPGHRFPEDVSLEVLSGPPYVSRGGEKLEEALRAFALNVSERTCIDVGASTGGFTDCLLQHGAARVFAVDVGKGQLHWKLRQDPRVVVLEEINARYLEPDQLSAHPDVAVLDVSFISLTKVLPAVIDVLDGSADIVALVKPQFEAGRGDVGKGGVVSDPDVRKAVVERIREFGVETLGLQCGGVCQSPLKGPAGNVEFLLWLKKGVANADKGNSGGDGP